MNKHIGFTLIELMVTLVVLAVVLGVALPSLNAQVINNRAAALGEELVVALNYARAEAIKRGLRVSICPSSDGATCMGSDDWAKGWMVFVDSAASDSADVIVGEPLRHWNNLSSKAVVSLKKGSAEADYLRFAGNGMLARTGAADTAQRRFSAYIEGCTGNVRRNISIGLAGMLNTGKASCP